MSHASKPEHESTDWGNFRRRSRSGRVDWFAEKFIFLVASSTFILLLLILVVLAKESLPIIAGQMTTVLPANPLVTPDTAATASTEVLEEYLGLDRGEIETIDPETLKLLVETRNEQITTAPSDKDAVVNTVSWKYLIKPHQWTGYERPEFIWQPTSEVEKFNIVPLFIGSLKTTFVALIFAVPLAIFAAVYLSQLAPTATRERLKPTIELIAGIPSVVLGFFALAIMASFLQGVFNYESRLNAFVAGIALGIAVIPIIFTISEDALTSVPRSYTQAALALGATKWQAAAKVVLPAALPGVGAAVVLGFGRAIGETMILLMASGNASIVSWDLFESVRTITATIAAELRETVQGGYHYRILFLLGTLLFALTFVCNVVADVVIHRFKSRLGGRA